MKLKFLLIQLLLVAIIITGCSFIENKLDIADNNLETSDDFNDYELQIIAFLDELKASDDILEIVKNYDDLTGIYIYVISKEGDILYHPNEDLIGKNLADELPLGKDIINNAKANQYETIKYVYNHVNREVLFTIIDDEIVVASYEDK